MSFLQIASWNVEHLSGNKRGTNNQSAYALADHVEMAGAVRPQRRIRQLIKS